MSTSLKDPRLRATLTRAGVAAASGIVAVATATVVGCRTVPESRYTHCMFTPKVFDWQRLDRNDLLIWSLPSREVYLLKLDEKLDRRMPDALAFVDGNQDGLLCGDGWDSVIATERLPATSSERITSREVSNIFFVEKIDERELAHLRATYRHTIGLRQRGSASASAA